MLDFSDLDQLAIDDLRETKNIDLILQYIKDGYFYNKEEEANQIFILLREIIEKSQAEGTENKNLSRYLVVFNLLKFFVLPFLPKEELSEVFSQNLILAFSNEIDLRPELKMAAVFYLSRVMADNNRLIILKAMQSNEEKIGPLAVSDWLKEYDLFFTAPKIRTELDQMTFLGSGPKALQDLDKKNKDLLLRLLQTYDYIKYLAVQLGSDKRLPVAAPGLPLAASVTAADIPQKLAVAPPVGRDQRNPARVAVAAPAKPRFTEAEIMARYQGGEQEWQKIQIKVGELNQSNAGDFAKVCDGFYSLLTGMGLNQVEILGYLYLLADEEKLDDLLKEDKRFYQLVADDLQSKGEKQLVNDFKMYPTAPQFIRWFLEIVLQKKLKLPENEAARIGLRLGNLLKQRGNDKYSQLAYFDMSSGEFRWKR